MPTPSGSASGWRSRPTEPASAKTPRGLAALIEPGSVADSDVLDAWTDCFVRITPDAERRPISFAAAAEGVDWDTTGVPVGVYELAGYTFQPPSNRWSLRPGFVKIVDDVTDPDQDRPAASITSVHNGYWWTTAPNQLDLCVDALEPATVVLEWARLDEPSAWVAFAASELEQDGPVQLEVFGPALEPASPEANVIVEGLLRVRVIDALEREFVAHASGSILFERCNGHCGDGPPPSDDEPDEPSDPLAQVDSAEGCACTLAPNRSPAPLLVLLPFARLRPKNRRRRHYRRAV